MEEQNSILAIEDLSIYLKITKSTLYRLAQEGKLSDQKIGEHWRFHKDAVDVWLKDNAISKVTDR
jgi:excisionase family DNA binding protein